MAEPVDVNLSGVLLDVDVAALARDLRTLSVHPRLDLLAYLRTPRTADEIAALLRLLPKSAEEHAEALVAAGLARKAEGRRSFGPVVEYALARGRMFGLTEELSKLAVARSAEDEDPGQTQAVAKASRGTAAMLKWGPSIIMVHGLRTGLVVRIPQGAPLTFGRDPASTICLDDDPYVSTRHAEVRPEGAAHVLVDAGSRNGTFLNWERLVRNAAVPLTPGDVVGVGKSLFVYRK